MIKALVVEGLPGTGSAAVRALESAGHTATTCFEGSAPPFPCTGVAGGPCPLDDGSVSVVVGTRDAPVPCLLPREVGLTCALRARLPVVLAGERSWYPVDAFADAIVPLEGRAIVGACEAVVSGRSPAHEQAANEVLACTPMSAEVRRNGPELDVVIHRNGVDLKVAQTAAVHVLQKVTQYDHNRPSVEVSVVD